jgi:hypothetical protein
MLVWLLMEKYSFDVLDCIAYEVQTIKKELFESSKLCAL